MMTVADDLRAARALIDTPEKWGKGAGYTGPDAPCLCAIGACFAAGSTVGGISLTNTLEPHLPPGFYNPRLDDGLSVARFNDAPATTHADILALFDRAIQAAEAS